MPPSAGYYREQSARARQLARGINDLWTVEALLRMAEDFEDIASDLEEGAIEIRHSSRLPQKQRAR
jgi:hypothetical protein